MHTSMECEESRSANSEGRENANSDNKAQPSIAHPQKQAQINHFI
jgi:hypothetical protein